MARKSLIEKQKKEAKYKTRKYNRCIQCGGPGVIIESSGYAGYALEKWHMREKFLADQVQLVKGGYTCRVLLTLFQIC